MRAVDAVVACHRADDAIIAWKPAERSVGAEARYLAVDKLGEARLQSIVADAPRFHGAGLEVLDQRVGAFEQPQQHRAAGRLGQIEADGALVAVDAYVVGSIAVMKRRSPIADLVAHRWLELDDVSAVIGKQLGREGSAKHAREVDDLHAGKCATRRLGARRPVRYLGHFSPWCTDAVSTHSVPQVCRDGNGRRYALVYRELPDRWRSVRTVHRNAIRFSRCLRLRARWLKWRTSAPSRPCTNRRDGCPWIIATVGSREVAISGQHFDPRAQPA